MSKVSNIEALETYFKKVVTDLKSDQAQKKIRASGESAASLKFSASATSGQLKGADYFFFQIVGRRPGKFAPPAAIIRWIKDKGITPQGKTTIEQLAYLINRKMARQGTDIYTGKREGLSFNEITGGENLETLIESIKDRKVAEIITFMKADLTGKPQTV